MSEWRNYALDDLAKCRIPTDSETDIVKLWNSVLKRKLPETSKIQTKLRNCTSPELINGLMSIKYSLTTTGHQSHSTPITPKLLTAGRTYHNRYNLRLKETKKKQKEEQKKIKLKEAETELTQAMRKKVQEKKTKKDVELQEVMTKMKKVEAE